MKLAAITRYETSSRPWNRLIEIAADRFPDTVEDLAGLRLRKVKLELRINEDATAYEAVLVGPDVATVEQRRAEEGMLALDEPLAALAIDTQQFEVTRARRLAREAARGELTPRYARSICEGFGYPAFDAELSRYQAEIQMSIAARKPRARRWLFRGRTQ